MKVEYIIKLYKKLEDLGLKLDSDCLDAVLLLDEETIDVLLESDLANRFDGISILLKNQKLTKLEDFSRVIKTVASCPKECYEPAFGVANNDDVIESGYCAILTEKVANAKTKATSEYARNTAMNIKKIGKIGLWEVVQIVDMIANASMSCNAEYAFGVAIYDAAINSNSLIELVKIIVNNKKPENSLEASLVARNINAVRTGYVTELTKIVASSKNNNASWAKAVATNYDTIIFAGTDIVELTKIVAYAKEGNGQMAALAATNSDVLKTNLAVELTKIIANSKKDNVDFAYGVARDKEIIEYGDVVELTKIVANAKNRTNARHASDVAGCINILGYNNTSQLIKIIADAPSNKKVECARGVALFLSDYDIGTGLIVPLLQIIMQSKDYVIPSLNELLTDDDVLTSGKILELAKIISDAKNEYCAETAVGIASSINVIRTGYVTEFTKVVVEAKSKHNADYAYSLILDELNEQNCKEVLELAKILSTISEVKAEFLEELLNEDVNVNDVLLVAKAIENIRLNKNNIDMVVSLIVTGDYNKSENPMGSLVSILKSTSDYIVFKDAYELDPANAIKGLNDLDKEFKGIDIKDTKKCYVKLPRKKKQDNE